MSEHKIQVVVASLLDGLMDAILQAEATT